MLANEHKKMVGDWLHRDERKDHCPFINLDDPETENGCSICEEWFPNIYENHVCPCTLYELADVIKTARRMVKGG